VRGVKKASERAPEEEFLQRVKDGEEPELFEGGEDYIKKHGLVEKALGWNVFLVPLTAVSVITSGILGHFYGERQGLYNIHDLSQNDVYDWTMIGSAGVGLITGAIYYVGNKSRNQRQIDQASVEAARAYRETGKVPDHLADKADWDIVDWKRN
tara:strand:- start:9017 stop:9478 length:462 start_codon:yes stop_codon:yes gene_type:complete